MNEMMEVGEAMEVSICKEKEREQARIRRGKVALVFIQNRSGAFEWI